VVISGYPPITTPLLCLCQDERSSPDVIIRSGTLSSLVFLFALCERKKETQMIFHLLIQKTD